MACDLFFWNWTLKKCVFWRNLIEGINVHGQTIARARTFHSHVQNLLGAANKAVGGGGGCRRGFSDFQG